MGGRGLLEERLNTVFLRNLLPTLDAWICYGRDDAQRTEKALLRYALGHLVADLEGDETPCYPEEFYLAPPLVDALTTGSLVKRKGDETWHVVMTPACDLVLRNGKRNVDSIILAAVVPEETVYAAPKMDAGRKKQLKRNNDKSCYHWLPNSKVAAGGYLDFRQLRTVSLDRFRMRVRAIGGANRAGFRQGHRVSLLGVLCAARPACHRRALEREVRRTRCVTSGSANGMDAHNKKWRDQGADIEGPSIWRADAS